LAHEEPEHEEPESLTTNPLPSCEEEAMRLAKTLRPSTSAIMTTSVITTPLGSKKIQHSVRSPCLARTTPALVQQHRYQALPGLVRRPDILQFNLLYRASACAVVTSADPQQMVDKRGSSHLISFYLISSCLAPSSWTRIHARSHARRSPFKSD